MCKAFFSRLKKNKNPNSKAYRREMAKRICGHHVRYITEKIDGVEEVIGKEGSLSVRDGELLVFGSGEILLRCLVDEMQAWELLSRDGVVITAKDMEHGGVERTVIVYYVYYR